MKYVKETRLFSKKYELVSPEKQQQNYMVRVKDKRMYFLFKYDEKWHERELTKFSNADFGVSEYKWLRQLNSKTVMSYLTKDRLFYYAVCDRAMGHDFYSILMEDNKIIGLFESVEEDMESPAVRDTYIYVFEKSAP